jgi:ABC-type multidrug transport system fused ATPase/permease subunit
MLYDRDDGPAPNPGGAPALQPKTVFQIMDNTFRIYRENAAPLLMLAALLIVPVNIIGAVLAGLSSGGLTEAQIRNMTPEQAQAQAAAFLEQNFGLFCIVLLVTLILGVAQTVILNGTVTTIASESLFGVRLTLREALEKTRPRFGTVLSSYFGFALVTGLVLIVGGVLAVICPLLIVILALVFYFSTTAGALIVPVAVLEDTRERLVRPHLLGKSRFWQILGISILVGLVSFVISLIVEAVLGALFSSPALRVGTTGVVFSITLSSIAAILIAPLLPIAMTQLYYDARIRKEGLAEALAAVGPDARPFDVRPIRTDEPIFSSQDILNIVVIFGIVILLTLLGGTLLATFFNTLVPGLGDLSTLGRPT